VVVGNQVIDESSFDTTSAPSVKYGQVAAALVGDNSFFGFTAPITGWRYRFELAPTFGDFQFENVLADMRRYVFVRPFTFAVRGLHFGRYGADASSNRLTPLFVGDPTIVRGYSAETFDPAECTLTPSNGSGCPEFDRLVGSRILAANAEFRIPLLGSEQFGLIRSPLFPVDVAPFVDAGLAWSRGDQVSFQFARNSGQRVPIVSAGVSARANLFGYAVIEAYYAHPFQRPQRNWVFGFQLAPGW
jgi:outer membrane protein assembly factor BamA